MDSVAPGAARLPAAAVTAFVRTEDRQQALQAGYQAVIQKPASPQALARTVLELVQGRGAVPASAQSSAAGRGGIGLPANPNDTRGPTVPAGLAPALPRLRALFVEDNLDLQEQIGWLLEDEGLDLVTCATGEDAIVEFDKGGFDVVVTDVSLPKMTGVALAKLVLGRAPHTWVVFSTGYAMGNRLTDFGPNVRSLLKPFEPEALREVTNEVRADLRRSSALAAARRHRVRAAWLTHASTGGGPARRRPAWRGTSDGLQLRGLGLVHRCIASQKQ